MKVSTTANRVTLKVIHEGVIGCGFQSYYFQSYYSPDVKTSPWTVFFIVNDCKIRGANIYEMGVGALLAPEALRVVSIPLTTSY